MEQTKMAQGDFARTQEGTANTMRELTAKFDEAKVAIGEALMPAFRAILTILKILIPVLTAIGKFFKENSDALKMLAIIVGTAAAAFYAYRAALVVVNVTQQLFIVVQTLMRGATLASIASTNGLAASMLKLNAVMRANPIGLIVTAIALVAAGFVMAWKKSETFREVVIKGVQIILNWWALLIEGVGKLIGLFAKLPGQGWAKGIAQGAQDAADKIRITSKNLSDLKSNFKGMGNVSMTTGTAGVSGGGTTVTSSTVNSGALKAAEDAAKKQLKIQEKAAKDLKDLREKLAEIQKNFEEDVSEAHKRELKSRLEAQKQFNNRLKDLNEGYAEQQIEIEENHSKRLVEIDSDYADSVLEIKANFAEKMRQIVQDNDTAIEDITANHFQKISDIQASYAEKLEAIVQKSISRLTDAFANATKTDVGKLFSDLEKSGDTSGEALVAKMKEHLTSIKKLAENASALAGAGFSQTFIEQVMAMGPDAGNKMAEALLKGSPATNQEMQDLFGELENVSNNGVTDLAKSMSAGGKLATQALMQEYAKTQRDLGEALAKQNNLYQMALADQAKKFKEALEKTNAELAKALEEADKKLKEQTAAQNEAYTKTLGDAQKSYDEAVANAARTRDEAFANAQEQLVEDIARSEKTMLDALTRLRKAFEDKLAPVKAVVSGIGAEIAGLGGAIEALLARLASAQNAYNKKAADNAQGILGGGTKPPASSPDDARNGNTNNLNLNINANTDASPESIANSALNAIRFGLPLGLL
jgi:F0F1-type ATP synthase membrane subunit b/b'